MAETRSPAAIGPYRIVAPIGVGSSSTVYRVVDEVDGTDAALKVLADNHSLVADMRQRFQDEATLLASMEHPGLARVLAVGETDNGQPYLAMELADRGDLRSRREELVASGREPTGSDLLALGRQLADALGALHEAGIVHRDVTPGNILIRSTRGPESEHRSDTSGPAGLGASPSHRTDPTDRNLLRPGERLMIADLGLAKDLAFASGLTAGAGTKGFAAPEQREVVSVVDHRTDVYGATAVIAWMAEGSSLEADLATFVTAGLADDPEDRFPSMEAWFASLSEAVARSRPPNRGVSPARSGRRWWSVFGVGLGGVVAAVALVIAAVGSDRSSEPTGAESTSPSPSTEPPSASSAEGDENDAPGNDAPGNGATGSTIDVPASATTTTPGTASPEGTTATSASTVTSDRPGSSVPVTLAPTTTDPQFAGSPRAYVRQPSDGATIDGDLVIVGDARSDDGIAAVRLVIRDLDRGLHWHPETNTWEVEWIRFELPVEPADGTEVAWGFTIPSDRLVPGRYLIRVWAVATPGNGDPVSNQIAIVVP